MLVSAVWSGTVRAGEPAAVTAADPPPAWELEHLQPEDGLSSLTVYSLLQDRVGFLWVGTEGGSIVTTAANIASRGSRLCAGSI